MSVLREVLAAMKGAQVFRESDDYLHAVFTSRLCRFLDDVEFHAAEPNTIHVRSMSRLGYWDFGANRRRVERIRKAFGERLAAAEGQPPRAAG